jgi:hypothetical protein
MILYFSSGDPMSRRTFLTGTLVLTLSSLLLAADAPKNLLKPTNKPDSWRLEEHETAKGKMTAEEDAIVFDVSVSDGTEWHLQAVQTGLDLKDGKDYAIAFKAKASADRAMQLNAMIDQDDWHAIGLTENVDLTKEWKEYKFEFKAAQTLANKNRVTFALGADKGKVWVKELTLTEK